MIFVKHPQVYDELPNYYTWVECIHVAKRTLMSSQKTLLLVRDSNPVACGSRPESGDVPTRPLSRSVSVYWVWLVRFDLIYESSTEIVMCMITVLVYSCEWHIKADVGLSTVNIFLRGILFPSFTENNERKRKYRHRQKQRKERALWLPINMLYDTHDILIFLPPSLLIW